MYCKVVHLLAYCVAALFAYSAAAHEMTPTYPRLGPSHIDDIYKAQVEVYNRRNDVEYYEIGVFDKEFKPVPFTTSYRIVKVAYLSFVNVDIYIRKQDVGKATYVCSQSKLRKDQVTRTAIASRICSKFK